MDVRCEPLTRPCKPSRCVSAAQRLDVARHRIVSLVTVHVHTQSALCRELAQQASHSNAPSLDRALEMRNAADDLNTQIERAFEIFHRTR